MKRKKKKEKKELYKGKKPQVEKIPAKTTKVVFNRERVRGTLRIKMKEKEENKENRREERKRYRL